MKDTRNPLLDKNRLAFRISEWAKIVGLTRHGVHAQIRRGALPCTTVGGVQMITRRYAVERGLLKEMTPTTTSISAA